MIPKYQYIADDLRTKIIKKEFLESNPLPTEAQLQEIYQVSRQTIRQAISLLVNEQYLYSKRGSGTFINPHRSHSHHTGSKKKNVGVITTYISDYIFSSYGRSTANGR